MAHGLERVRIGGIEVISLCDMVARFPRPFAMAFPTIPPERHGEIRARYPETFDGPDDWLLHDHCYVVRTGRRTVLVDTGVGDVGALGAEWFRTTGGLPSGLRAAGVEPEEIDLVAITHAHLDHIGWNLAFDDAEGVHVAWFPNARYVLQRAEWEGFREAGDDWDRRAFGDSLEPLQSLGCLDLIEGSSRLAPGLTAHHAPGHTPGHQVVLVESDGSRALLSGDLTNHPAQVTNAAWRTGSDLDPEDAAEQRARWLDDVESDGTLLCTAHYPQPFGRLVREEGERVWQPTGG